MRLSHGERTLVLPSMLLVAALALAAWTVSRAFMPAARSDYSMRRAPAEPTAIPEREPMEAGALEEIVDHDLFHRERRKPASPFRRPDEIAAARAPVVAPGPAATLRLIGTVLAGGKDAVALCQVGGDVPRLVRVGGTIGGYTLHRVEPGRALFTSSSGETTDLRVLKVDPK